MNRDSNRSHDAQLPGLTVQREVPTVSLQASLPGTLEIDPDPLTNCLVVRTPISTAVDTHTLLDVDVAWPPGWTVELRDGTPTLIDATGQPAPSQATRYASAEAS